MNREQMIEKVAKVIWANGGGIATFGDDHRRLATHALDAILPQVSTVEEMDSLPGRSLVESNRGVVYRWRSYLRLLQTVTESPLDYEVANILREGPLTVLWRPS